MIAVREDVQPCINSVTLSANFRCANLRSGNFYQYQVSLVPEEESTHHVLLVQRINFFYWY
jgi:hypothetical protein